MGNFKRGLKVVGKALKRKAPAIVAGMSCGGVIFTAVLSAKAYVAASDILEEAGEDIDKICNDADDGVYSEDEANEMILQVKKETAKDLIIAYAPAVLSGALTITGIILSHKIQYRRQAILTGLVNAAQSALIEYKEEARALLKPKEIAQIEESIAKRSVEKKPIGSEDDIYDTGRGPHLLQDYKTKRYFRGNVEYIKHVLFDITKRARADGEVSLNDLYYDINLAPTPDGDDIGWIDEDVVNPGDEIELQTSWLPNGHINPQTGLEEPCCVIKFWPEPHLI